MSFFSQPATASASTSAPGSSSLITSLNLDTTVPSDPAAKRKSIFEPSSSTAARAGTLLFGQPTPTTSAATPSMFGTTATTAPATNSFGATSTSGSMSGGLLGAASTTTGAPASSVVFGNVATNPSTAQFASSIAQPAAPKPSFSFGQTATQPAQNSVFGTSTINAPLIPQNSTPAPGVALGIAQNQNSAHFRGLVERQNKKVKFATHVQPDSLTQIPSMNMDLGDLTRRAQGLGGRTTKQRTGVGRDSRAHYLLSGSGIVPGQAYKDFQRQNGELLHPLPTTATDFAEEGNAYLKGIQTKGREVMLKESMERIYREVDAYMEQNLGVNFDEQKQRIMQHFGLRPKDGDGIIATPKGVFGQSSRRSIFGSSGLDKSLIGDPSVGGTRPFFGSGINENGMNVLSKTQSTRDLRVRERLFIEKVQAMNQARLQDQPYKVMQQFGVVEATPSADHPKQLHDAYVALQHMTREEHNATERQYVGSYIEPSSPSATIQLKRQILDGSRAYLEQTFYQGLEQLITKHPQKARIGGVPTALNKIRGYIRIKEDNNDLATDPSKLQRFGDTQDLCWVIVFYLLRSGHVKEAAKYVAEHEAFQTTDRKFVSYISNYVRSPNRRLDRKFQQMIDGEYQQRTRVAPQDTIDPYRIACYKVIGRCDLEQRNLDHIGKGVEDWLWLQFALAREPDTIDDAVDEVFGLEQIADTVSEIGQKHFQRGQPDSSNSYGTFFLMQILAGMFEQAVEYLHDFNPVSAVHLAIALSYYGLLRVEDYRTAGNELMRLATDHKPHINLVPLIAYYTSAFRAALPTAAVDYIALICLNSDLRSTELAGAFTDACHECLRELCLETREFAALLGDIRGDGTRLAGAIQQRGKLIQLNSHEQVLRSITIQAAAVADSRGQTADAVLLYHLCDDFDNVANVLARALSDAVAVELGETPMSLQPLKPRAMGNGDQSEAHARDSSSLSLTQSTSSPVELATNMMHLYDSNAIYYGKINPVNRHTCQVLLHLLRARSKLEGSDPDYLGGVTEINDVGILPLEAGGNIQIIRQMATGFGALPQLVARASGTSILWAIRAIGAERERLAQEGSWSAYGSEDDLAGLKNQLSQMAKDLMVFAGLVKYKLPSRVYDMLTRAGSDIGSY